MISKGVAKKLKKKTSIPSTSLRFVPGNKPPAKACPPSCKPGCHLVSSSHN